MVDEAKPEEREEREPEKRREEPSERQERPRRASGGSSTRQRLAAASGPSGWNDAQRSITAAFVVVGAALILSQGLYDKFKDFVSRPAGQSSAPAAQQPQQNPSGGVAPSQGPGNPPPGQSALPQVPLPSSNPGVTPRTQ